MADNSPEVCFDGCGRAAAGYGPTTGVPLCEGSLASEKYNASGPMGAFCGLTDEEVKARAK